MKHLPCVLLLTFLASCKALGVPFMGPDESPEVQAQAIGTAAGDAAGMLTGNPLVDMGVTALVAAGAGFYLRLKKKTKTIPSAT